MDGGSIQKHRSDKSPLLPQVVLSNKSHTTYHSEKDATSPPSSPDTADPKAVKTYLWRWVILFVFFANNLVTNYLWIMSAVIADVMRCYYGISDTLLNLLSTSFMISYCFIIWPAMWIMAEYGLKVVTVFASACVAAGASLRVMGSGRQLLAIF